MSIKLWQHFEQIVNNELALNGYKWERQVKFGVHPDGRERILDTLITGEAAIAVSAKYQRSRGTCEEKITWEVLSLTAACISGLCNRAYVVMGGDGWGEKHKAWCLAQGPQEHLILAKGRVKIITLDEFRNLIRDHSL